MREERKLNKAIKQDGIDTQSEILDELKRRYPQYVEQSDNKPAPTTRKKRAAVISMFAVAAASAAIIVPCALLLPNSGNSDDKGKIRYCTQSEYDKQRVEYTVFDYRKNNDLNFLYFDWYESGEDWNTFCYTSKSDGEVLCLEEQAYLRYSDEMVKLSLTKVNLYLSAFDPVFDSCKVEQTVEGHTVKWSINEEGAACIFEDNGYRYFIQIQRGSDENRLFALVAELLEKD